MFTLAAINFCCIVGSIGIGLWLPQIIKSLGISSGVVGPVVALPYLLGAVAMTLWARLANRSTHRLLRGQRTGVCCTGPGECCADRPAAAEDRQPVPGRGRHPVFPGNVLGDSSTFLTGRAAAGGLALIVSIGNLGGFTGPFLIGLIKDATQSFTLPFFAVASILLIGTCLMLWLGDPAKQQTPQGQGQAA